MWDLWIHFCEDVLGIFPYFFTGIVGIIGSLLQLLHNVCFDDPAVILKGILKGFVDPFLWGCFRDFSLLIDWDEWNSWTVFRPVTSAAFFDDPEMILEGSFDPFLRCVLGIFPSFFQEIIQLLRRIFRHWLRISRLIFGDILRILTGFYRSIYKKKSGSPPSRRDFQGLTQINFNAD